MKGAVALLCTACPVGDGRLFLCFVLPCVLQDPYNKERIALVKKLKVDGVAWVSKYARGGSARSLSARRWVGPSRQWAG